MSGNTPTQGPPNQPQQAPVSIASIGAAINLAPGERIVAADEFIFSLAHFFLKTKVALTDRRVAWQRPNTLLGVIPIGMQKDSFPLSNIASIGTSTALGIWRLLVGLVLILGGIARISAGWFAVLVGLWLVLGAFQTRLSVTNTGGQRYNLRLAVTDREKAQRFADEINSAIAAR